MKHCKIIVLYVSYTLSSAGMCCAACLLATLRAAAEITLLHLCSCVGRSSTGALTQVTASSPQTNPACEAVTIKEALNLNQDPNSMGWVALDACLLIMFLVVIRFLTYVALRHKTSRK